MNDVGKKMFFPVFLINHRIILIVFFDAEPKASPLHTIYNGMFFVPFDILPPDYFNLFLSPSLSFFSLYLSLSLFNSVTWESNLCCSTLELVIRLLASHSILWSLFRNPLHIKTLNRCCSNVISFSSAKFLSCFWIKEVHHNALFGF